MRTIAAGNENVLKRALEKSRNFECYRSLYQDNPTALTELNRIPYTDKEFLKKNQDIFFVGELPTSLALTSGTTAVDRAMSNNGGAFTREAPLLVPRYPHTEICNQSTDAVVPLVLHLQRSGSFAEKFTAPGVLSLPFSKLFHFDAVVALLNRTFEYKGYSKHIEYLVMSVSAASVCRYLLSARNFELPFERSIDVLLYADNVESTLLQSMQRIFHGKVTSSFGLAEAPQATFFSKSQPHWYSTDCKNAFVEFIQIPELITANIFELAVTTCDESTNGFPLIRYRTGDSVFLRNSAGAIEFRPLGRIAKSLLSSSVFVPHLVVKEAVNNSPAVRRMLPDAYQPFDMPYTAGVPIFNISLTCNRPLVQVELNYSPILFPTRATEDMREIENEINNSILDAGLDLPFRIAVEALEPGALKVTKSMIKH